MRSKIIALILAAVLLCGAVPFAVFAQSEQNLVFGKSYTVETGEPIEKAFGDLVIDGVEYNVDNGNLTDGSTANDNKNSDLWFRAYSGKSRIITFDLGEICSVSSVEAGFLEDRENDIFPPRYIKVYYSADGENYQCGGEFVGKYPAPLDGKSKRHRIGVLQESSFAVRYVKIEYSCYDFTYCDEIYVKGKRTLSGDEITPKGESSQSEAGYIQSISQRKDMVKLYNGFGYRDLSVGILTEEELLPYVAYLNKNGEITGKLFDGAVLIPCDSEHFYKSNTPSVNYEAYINDTFTQGRDLSALDRVVSQAYENLDLNEKFGVFLSIPYPEKTETPFGDINGDGVAEGSETLNDRLAVSKWYIDKCVSAFKAAGYTHLELCGFNWLKTELNYNYSDDEEQLVTDLNAYITRLGYNSICSYGYLSAGFDSYEDLGFDAGVMQSGIIKNDLSLEMLLDYSRSVYNNRLGVELETGNVSDYLDEGDEYLRLGRAYENYLFRGKKYGYSMALNIYDQGVGPGTLYEFCHADVNTVKGEYLRRLYDLTYGYINDTYNNLSPSVSVETDVEMVYGDSRATIDFVIKDADSYSGDVVVEFPEAPEHGKVVVQSGNGKLGNNKLEYLVDEGFEGTDYITLCVSDGFNRTDPIKIRVSVTKPRLEEEDDVGGVAVDPLPLGGKLELPPWLVFILAFLAIVMVAVALGTIIKPKKYK